MIAIRQAIVTEGRYDRIKLQSLVDALIITTGGFRIFTDNELMAQIRAVAAKSGIVVITDSDRAGFLIRNHIRRSVPAPQVKHAYIPDIPGAERRKRRPSGEGLLGVEGLSAQILIKALRDADVDFLEDAPRKTGRRITTQMFYEDGLTGGEHSARLRALLVSELGLPARISTKELLNFMNRVCEPGEYDALVKKIYELFTNNT